MGIPRMFGHLQTFAVPKILGCKTSGCRAHQNRQNIIIDGPSLAFYINYRILAQRSSSTNPLDAIPSYTELGMATLAFLDELRRHGAVMYNMISILSLRSVDIIVLIVYFSDSIFFDGFLPLDKSATRKNRLETSLNQLFTFHAMFLDGFHVSRSSRPSPVAASQLFDASHPVPGPLRGIPIPVFLVPAVLDALRDSEYASVTAVVPDEADPFCAGTACKNGGIILTSDSDLLVYDLGETGAVAFFSQIDLLKDDESSTECEVFRASVSQPSEIAQRLGLENLKQFSFELLRDSSISLTEIVRRAKQQVPEPLPYDVSRQKTFHEFCKDYDTKTFDFQTKNLGLKYKPENSQFLDPRISELILTSSSLPSFYLPLLIEDPSKATAWNVSRDLRQFAYSCLKFNVSNFSSESVMEFNRRGQRIEPELIQTLPKMKVVSYTNNLATGLESFTSLFSDFPNAVIWRTFALSEILHRCAETDKKPPSRSALASQFTGQVNRKISWLHIHLSAQMEAVLYSLRMLKQILHHRKPLPSPQPSEPLSNNPSSNNSFSRLSAILDTLPPLNQLFPSRLELATQPALSPTDIDHLLDLLASHLQPAPSPTAAHLDGENIQHSSSSCSDPHSTDGFQTVPHNKKARQLKKAKQVQTASAQSRDSSKSYSSNNMFDALLQG